MSWNSAHGVAMIAAAQAHKELGPPADGYVDVFGALRQAGVEVVGRRLGALLGLYVDRFAGGPACLVNTGLEEVSMRHTAAHELGHHRLGHGTSIDHEEQSSGRWGEGWPQHEREAEAFASWFLMPLSAARAALSRCGLRRPGSPLDAYRMARWLGTPYATTVRHLVRLKLIDRSTEAMWLKHSPASLKADLTGGLPLGTQAHAHVLLPAAHGATLRVTAGDCVLLGIPAAFYDNLPAGLSRTPPGSGSQMSFLELPDAAEGPRAVWVNEDLEGDTTMTATITAPDAPLFRVTLQRTPSRDGSDAFWH
ncbi:ImmA/IrrE family metallo-endopeptidase [Streptomyces sp. NBC_00258]|uniref:ImmA/IrrE family metallo-endopeptidase n=1 Tax=Streptomyces sp. NBC_00258 TaxID=2903642 RepID=UPI002E2C2DC6|nr:ImmA/IrrE family metallo-endopeptidase [Streptomyces sp. NBC_00258]